MAGGQQELADQVAAALDDANLKAKVNAAVLGPLKSSVCRQMAAYLAARPKATPTVVVDALDRRLVAGVEKLAKEVETRTTKLAARREEVPRRVAEALEKAWKEQDTQPQPEKAPSSRTETEEQSQEVLGEAPPPELMRRLQALAQERAALLDELEGALPAAHLKLRDTTQAVLSGAVLRETELEASLAPAADTAAAAAATAAAEASSDGSASTDGSAKRQEGNAAPASQEVPAEVRLARSVAQQMGKAKRPAGEVAAPAERVNKRMRLEELAPAADKEPQERVEEPQEPQEPQKQEKEQQSAKAGVLATVAVNTQGAALGTPGKARKARASLGSGRTPKRSKGTPKADKRPASAQKENVRGLRV